MRPVQAETCGKATGGDSAQHAATRVAKPSVGDTVFAVERLLLEQMMRSIGNPPLQLVLWDGQEIGVGEGSPIAKVVIRDRRALLSLIANPQLWFGDLYAAERVEVDGNLPQVLELIYRSLRRASYRSSGQRRLAPLLEPWRDNLRRSRLNIHHHYDIGNDFYKLWLDEEMVYTCAYFESPAMGLDEAQRAKLDYVCRKIRLAPGETVVEAGCGWGGLALYMAKQYGARVKAFNISKEQIAYARERARGLGLDRQVEFIEDDYRNIRGEFDAFVSVGMLEHVGISHYETLGAVIDGCLKETGRGLIHTIGRDYPRAMNAWIERRIFPGACPPSLAQIMRIFEPFRFTVLDVENLRLHYAMTLEHWLQRYEAASGRVAEMFDPTFVRTWRLYLAGSLAAFRSGDLQLFQVAFSRAGENRIPWTRHDLYRSA